MSQSYTRLSLRVSPGSNTDSVVGRYGSRWKVRVSSPPERGRANDAVCELLSSVLGVDRSKVKVVSGAGSRDKIIEVQGIDSETSERLLLASIQEGEINESTRT